MKLGVNLINFGPAATPENLTRWVEVVEGLGYDSLLTSDHVATTPDVHAMYPDPFYEPLSTLGWLAGVTERIMIGSTVMIVPYRNPLETARASANIDQLSGGRAIFGAGIGWAQNEFEALGVPFNRRGAITDEYLDVIKRFWTEDVISHDGRFAQIEGAHTLPRPVQTPHPPIWIGGSSDAALRRAVRVGGSWHPIRARVGALRTTGVPRLRAVAEETGAAIPPVCPRIGLDITDAPLDDDSRIMGSGTVDQIRADLTDLHDLGCDHVILDTSYNGVAATLDAERAWSMLETIASDGFDLASGEPR